jgi:hypothetical protein
MKKINDIVGWLMVLLVGSVWVFIYWNYYKKEVVFEKLLDRRLNNQYVFDLPSEFNYDATNLAKYRIRKVGGDGKRFKIYEYDFDLVRTKGDYKDTLKYNAEIYKRPDGEYEVFGIRELKKIDIQDIL